MRTFRVQGGLAAQQERLADLAQSPAAPHRPTASFPAPDAAHYRDLARRKRREAQSIARHIPPAADDQHARFARNQARKLLQEAESYEQMAGGAL